MYTAALFTMAKTWKQPKCPPADELIQKMWYKYTMKKGESVICDNMYELGGHYVK